MFIFIIHLLWQILELNYINILAIPQLKDNYAYCIFTTPEKGCSLIDESKADTHLLVLNDRHYFSCIKHADHCGRNLVMLKEYPALQTLSINIAFLDTIFR